LFAIRSVESSIGRTIEQCNINVSLEIIMAEINHCLSRSLDHS